VKLNLVFADRAPWRDKTAPMHSFIENYASSANFSMEEAMKQLMAQTGVIPMGRMRSQKSGFPGAF
jgi:hypothetical protein